MGRLPPNEERWAMLGELAAILIGVGAGELLAWVFLPMIPAPLRYLLGFIVGWKWIADIPMYFVHSGIDLDAYKGKRD